MRIRPAHFRAFAEDIRATFVPQVAPNVPEYDPNFFYPESYLVVFQGLYYRSRLAGVLPEPTPGQETADWTPALMPLSPVLPYREMSVQQGQDFSSDGLLEPSKLYRLTGRVDANGDPLADVLVVAVSRHSVAGADAYTIGIDIQTREEFVLPVAYELTTDTTMPRAAGAGGAVDAYTKAEADTLLATKGSAQVQEQHTLQLKTLGVQGSPVYGYLETGGAPVGYASFDDALADVTQKTFYTFNAATLVLTKSNAASGAGWAYSASAQGTTMQLGENVVLTLPGDEVGTLTFLRFYIEQAPATRGGKVRLLTTALASTPVALLPRLEGYCGKPLELANGGAVLLSGYYTSLLGTGTVYALEPFQADNVAAGVNVVPVGGRGTVKTVNGQAPNAAGELTLPQNDIYGYSQPKRDQVFSLFTSNSQFKAVDVPLAGDTSTNLGSQIVDLTNGDLYTLVPDKDNTMPDPANSSILIATPTWLRTSFS